MLLEDAAWLVGHGNVEAAEPLAAEARAARPAAGSRYRADGLSHSAHACS